MTSQDYPGKRISESLELVRAFRASRVGGDPVDAALVKLERAIQHRMPDDLDKIVDETRAALEVLAALDGGAEIIAAKLATERKHLN